MSAVTDMLRRGDLYDYYGDLLSEHQKKIYESYVCEDLSLSEISESAGISRQGVSDLIRRCTQMMEDYDDKLGLIDRSKRLQSLCDEITEATDDDKVRKLIARMKEEI